ncbi:MAG: NUDIX hydrolase [Pseudomonadota bacterium]
MIPRVGEAIRARKRYRLRPGIYGLLLHGRSVVLTHQMAPTPEFQLPGGGIDPGEHSIQALHREVLEETGWRMRVDRRLGAFRRFVYMPEYDLWAEKLCAIYLCRAAHAVAPPSEPGHTAHIVPLELACEILGNPGDRLFLRRVSA